MAGAPRQDVIRARYLIDHAIDYAELALAKLQRAGLDTTLVERAATDLSKQHVACSEALR